MATSAGVRPANRLMSGKQLSDLKVELDASTTSPSRWTWISWMLIRRNMRLTFPGTERHATEWTHRGQFALEATTRAVSGEDGGRGRRRR